jgi:AraC-like DNA-binding protein
MHTKKHTGYTITDYIKGYRILIAKNLILETERKIEYIACSVGFYDMIDFFVEIFWLLYPITSCSTYSVWKSDFQYIFGCIKKGD